MKPRNKGAHPLFHYSLLRLYSVLRANSTSALPSSIPTPTSQGVITPKPKSNIVPLAIGLTFGLLIFVIVVLGAFYLQRRRRRRSALLDTHATPLHHTSPAQGIQLSVAPRESKRRPQPNHPPTLGSTLSSGAPTATGVPIMSIRITESDMPPSYESHMRTARVATAE